MRQHQNETILEKCKRNEKGNDVLPDGNIIATTGYFFCLHVREGQEAQRVIVGMTSTQLKKARLWLNMMASLRLTRTDGTKYQPPMFAREYAVSTVAESNAKGSWFGWKIESGGWVREQGLITNAREAAAKSRVNLLAAPPAEEPGEPENLPM